MGYSALDGHERPAWNAGRKIGAKRALKQKEVWAIRFWLEQQGRLRDRALFDLAIDSKLRGFDLVRVRIGDLVTGDVIRERPPVEPTVESGLWLERPIRDGGQRRQNPSAPNVVAKHHQEI